MESKELKDRKKKEIKRYKGTRIIILLFVIILLPIILFFDYTSTIELPLQNSYDIAQILAITIALYVFIILTSLIDYFNDDGLSFISRKEGIFALNNIDAEDLKIFKYDGSIVYNKDDENSKINYTDKLELMIYLYADIITNIENLNKKLSIDVINKVRMATTYNPRRNFKNIENAIHFMKNEIWINLYGKAYDDYEKVNDISTNEGIDTF